MVCKKHYKMLFLSGFYIFTQIAFAGGSEGEGHTHRPQVAATQKDQKVPPFGKNVPQMTHKG